MIFKKIYIHQRFYHLIGLNSSKERMQTSKHLSISMFSSLKRNLISVNKLSMIAYNSWSRKSLLWICSLWQCWSYQVVIILWICLSSSTWSFRLICWIIARRTFSFFGVGFWTCIRRSNDRFSCTTDGLQQIFGWSQQSLERFFCSPSQ